MYINPFAAGVLATILVETAIVVFVIIAVAIKQKGGRK